jgi:beta-lactamase regulating signal transducer with metallopeptidase domain
MNAIVEFLNVWGARFAGFALPMFLQSAVLILLLFALDLAFRKRVRATIRYAVWMLALVKLALPPSLSSPTGAAYWLSSETIGSYSAPTSAILPVANEATIPFEFMEVGSVRGIAVDAVPPTLTRRAILFLSWLTIALGLGIWVAWRLRRVVNVIRQSSSAPETARVLSESCRRQLGIKREIPVRCAAIGSPAICGVIRPIILIPPGLVENLSGSEMRSVLMHELAHYQRGDLWVSQAQILLQIVYWYNPLVWLANGIIRHVREQAVDERVLVEMGSEAPEYPATLLRVAKLGLRRPLASLGLMGILEPGHGLKQRILHIMSRPVPRTARIGVRGLAALLLLALVALPMACRHKTDSPPQKTASESAHPNTGVKDEMIVTISKEGALTFQNGIVSLDDLQKKMAEAVRRNPQATLAIQADSAATWAKVSKVLNAARAAHMNVVSAISKAAPPSDWSDKRFMGRWRLAVSPGMLTAEEAVALEAKLAEDPEDFDARRDLMAHYRFRDRSARAKHVLWIIEHHPEFSDNSSDLWLDVHTEESAYGQGKILWLRNVQEHPTNAKILGNAVAYFSLSDHATAEDLLTKAQALEPQNPVWSERLGQQYKLHAMVRPGTDLAAKALAQFERAQTQTTPAIPGSPRLVDLAKMAFDAGDMEKARTYANELLGPGLNWSGGGNAGDAFFHGNIVLGRIALREGKMDEAKKRLLEAGKTKGSPVLGSFGPNMTLAKELLEKGETNTVLEYFKECEVFWKMSPGEGKLGAWTEAVKNGKTPDFGSNLVY